MNVLIIYAHPSEKSYTFQILQQLVSALTDEGHSIEISDLYKMNFLSDMTREEYEREGFRQIELPIPTDIQEEHKKIDKADCVFFLYPVWWSDCPAKLKGWFDRVYSVGYVYGYNENANDQHMKTLRSGHVICTAGYSNDFLHEIGIAESMKTIMVNDRLGKRFENKEMTILGGTLNVEDVRLLHSTKIKEIAVGIKRFNTSAS